LFHGPTLAFKDIAMQLLGHLFARGLEKQKRRATVIVATSGDTGSAAIGALKGQPNVDVVVLHPHGRVSDVQRRQMTSVLDSNVHNVALEGSFDDTQLVLKETFGDSSFRNEVNLSAVNSINLARVLAQCVYYICTYWRLPDSVRGQVEFVVPTGNFGNILAGWMTQQMGLPIRSFRVATNQNDILHRLFTTGEYEVHRVSPSLAPSMDIQVASNFERFLYYAENSNPEKVREIMNRFKKTGIYRFSDFDSNSFTSSRTDDLEIKSIISQVYKNYGYVVDPHTACGLTQIESKIPQVVLATAHPAKFPETIVQCIGIEPTHPSLEILKSRKMIKHKIASNAEAVKIFIRENS